MNVVEEIASAYVAKIFSGEISSKDKEDLESWLSEESENFESYKKALATWNMLEDLREPLSDKKLLDKYINISEPKRISFFKQIAFLSIAVSFLFVITFSFFYAKESVDTFNSNRQLSYQTLVGQQKSIKLSDGSQIKLNTATKLNVNYTDKIRHLKLEYGEAFFDITKEPKRPLKVDFGNGVVTVLGTKFNINHAGDEVVVAVIEGSVAVDWNKKKADSNQYLLEEKNQRLIDRQEKSMLLKKGDIAYFSKNKALPNKTTPKESKIAGVVSWEKGIVKFYQQPLIDVVAELNRYSRRKILIEDIQVAQLPVNAVFNLDDVDIVLKGIEKALPIKVTEYIDRYIIIGE